MQDLRRQLPQLDYLVAFEAAARLGSFTKAAHELNITQSAVSQQIRNLEQNLSLTLFERAHKSVRLTEEGKIYHNSVSLALVHLLSATNKLRQSKDQTRLTIATDVTTAALWLSPRLCKFHKQHADIQIRLISSDIQPDIFQDEVDLAITHGTGDWPGYVSEPLFTETVFPLCSPEYLKTYPIHSLQDLEQAKLIELEYEHWNWMNWTIWLTEKGLSPGNAQMPLICNSYPTILETAAQGLGIALGWSYFADDLVNQGRLIRPIKDEVTTNYAYHIVSAFTEQPKPQVQAFRDWLIEERDFCSPNSAQTC